MFVIFGLATVLLVAAVVVVVDPSLFQKSAYPLPTAFVDTLLFLALPVPCCCC